ncbi:MAG: glycerophosphodiester phosphodiesterase [Pseudomonadota bacterium]
MLVIAHRGASGYKPENTIEAFEAAVEMGADFIEIDVQETADDKLVVWHDTRFKNGVRSTEISYAELKKLASVRGIDVPLFSQTLKVLNNRIKINVEIKTMRIMELLLKEIYSYDADKLLFSSFNHEFIRIIRRKTPHLKTAALIVSRLLDPLQVMASLDTDILIQHFQHVDRDYIEFLHNNNKKLYVWNIDNERDMRDFKKMEVDGIFTDYPDIAVKIAREQ